MPYRICHENAMMQLSWYHLLISWYFNSIFMGNSLETCLVVIAAIRGHLDILKYCIDEVNCTPNVAGHHRRSFLHDDAKYGQLEITEYLIESHNCETISRDYLGNTPVHIA